MKNKDGKRDDVTMTSEDGEGGLHIVWHVPKVEKGERLEVSFDIKGSGEVDAEALNRFHGVHFGDEIESDDLPSLEEETPEEASEAEGDDADAADEDAKPAAPAMKFREDMLLRVMDAAGIDTAHRDAFVAFAVDYDHDDNGYLKKAELEDAAAAWNEAHASTNDAPAEEASEDASEEPAGDEAIESEATAEEAPATEGAEEKSLHDLWHHERSRRNGLHSLWIHLHRMSPSLSGPSVLTLTEAGPTVANPHGPESGLRRR